VYRIKTEDIAGGGRREEGGLACARCEAVAGAPCEARLRALLTAKRFYSEALYSEALYSEALYSERQ